MRERLAGIWRKHDATIGLGIITVLLVAVGVVIYLVVRSSPMFAKEETGCTTDIVSLAPATYPPLVLDTINMLAEGGVLPSLEAGIKAFIDAYWIFDPDEDSELEYWLYFQSGPQIVAIELNIGCPLDEENYPLYLEYEGSRIIEGREQG